MPIKEGVTKRPNLDQCWVTTNFLRDGFVFVEAAVTKMPTTRVPAYRCDTDWSSRLDGAHPTVEDDEVLRKVCFSNRPTGCKYPTEISVGYLHRNHSSIYIDPKVHFFRRFHAVLFSS